MSSSQGIKEIMRGASLAVDADSRRAFVMGEGNRP